MTNATPAIQIENLSYAYGRAEAVHQLNLSVRPGRCYGLFGRNGAGKTTTMKCLGSVDILRKRRRCFNRYRLKLNPSSSACRICMGRDRPGARAESFRFTEENKLSIKARRR